MSGRGRVQFSRGARENCTRPLLLALLLLALSCAQPATERGIIAIAIPVSPNNLDPRFGTDENSARAHELLYNDLLRWDEQTRLAPGLACAEKIAQTDEGPDHKDAHVDGFGAAQNIGRHDRAMFREGKRQVAAAAVAGT